MDAIYKALAAAQKDCSQVPKGGHNKFDNYDYARMEDYVATAQETLGKHGLAVICSIKSTDHITIEGSKTPYGARVEVEMTLLHESGQTLAITCRGEAFDRSDKAIFKAITGARKYGLAMLLNLGTCDDPEDDGGAAGADQKPGADSKKPRKTAEKESSPPAKAATKPEPAKAAEEPKPSHAPNPEAWTASRGLFKAAQDAGRDTQAWTKIALKWNAEKSKMPEDHAKEAWEWIIAGAKGQGLKWDREAKAFFDPERHPDGDDIPFDSEEEEEGSVI